MRCGRSSPWRADGRLALTIEILEVFYKPHRGEADGRYFFVATEHQVSGLGVRLPASGSQEHAAELDPALTQSFQEDKFIVIRQVHDWADVSGNGRA
jgi:hypothetical protein